METNTNNVIEDQPKESINLKVKLPVKLKGKKNLSNKIKSLQQHLAEKKSPNKNKANKTEDKNQENIQIIYGNQLESPVITEENPIEIRINNIPIAIKEEKNQRVADVGDRNFILPIIVIEDEYYEKILNFMNLKKDEKEVRERNRIKNENTTCRRESKFGQNIRNTVEERMNQRKRNDPQKMERSLSIIENFNSKYKTVESILTKLIKMRGILRNFNPLDRNENDKIFLAGVVTDSNTYSKEEIEKIYEELQKDENFKQNCKQELMQWANSYLSNIQIYCENVINQKPSKIDNLLFITKISNEAISEENNEELSHLSKNPNWNIIYHTSGKKFQYIYEEVDYIEEEINCNFLITNDLKYLSKLLELIKLQNNEKNPNKITITCTLLINGDVAKATLEFINQNQYNNYFNSIIIFCDSNIEKIKQKIDEYKDMVKGIFNDKNEIILALKKNKSESLPMETYQVVSLPKYNNKYVFLHENIANFYQNKFKEKEEVKEDFKLYLTQTYENESKENFEKCLEELIDSNLTEDIKKKVELLYENNKNEDDDSKTEFKKFMKEFYESNSKVILPKFHEFVLKEEYESSIKKFSDFINSTALDLKFILSKLNLQILKRQLKKGTEEYKAKIISETKSKSLINSVMSTFSEFDEKEKYNKIIDKFISEEGSFFQDFNYWLRELDENLYDKISYFISEMIRLINKFGKGLDRRDINLYKNLKMNFADLLEYKKYEGNAIFFPSFTVTSLDKEKCDKIFCENSKEEIDERKKKEEFNVLVNIEYNFLPRNKIFSCFDMSEFEKDNYLFLPFSSFKIKNVEIDEENYTAVINLLAINKKEILEKYINKDRKVYYNDIYETVEIKKVKNILIHCTDTRELSDLKNRCKFMEELADGNFLITNTNEYFYKILSEIKKENKSMSKSEILIKFELILFEATAKDTLSYIKENDFLKYFDNIIIMSGNEEKYKQELDEKIVQKVFTNKFQAFNFIREIAQGSLLSLRIFTLVTTSKYYNKYHIYHEIISRFYQKISENYFAVANEIIKDFISQNPNLINNDLIKCLRAFQDENVKPKARNRKIIRKYTAETGSFYQDFNNWLRSPDKTTIEKIGYFISNFMYSLNEYGRVEDTCLTGEHELYRGLKLSFGDLLLYKMKINSVIIYLPPTSTTINKKTAEFFASDGIKENQYAVMMIIKYNCKDDEIPTAVDVTDLSEFGEDERLFIPFSFFKIKNVIINEKDKKGIIEMDALTREKINENEISPEAIIKFNKEKNMMECTKNKVVVYNVENDNTKTNIFGFQFVLNNKNNVKLRIEDKDINLCQDYCFKNQGENLVEIIEKRPIKNASHMFFDCNSIISLDTMKNWNMSKVNDISGMFSGCFSIISVSPLKNWNINNVENASDLFSGCISLTYIDALKFWNFNRICDTNCMFYNCNSITSILALKNWDMSNVLDVTAMFKNCNSLRSINCLRNWNLNNVKNTNSMFYNCSSIIPIDGLKKWNMENVKDTNSMFANCSSILSIDALKNWNMRNVIDMSYMFNNCEKIAELKALNNWNVESVKNMNGMFEGCKKIMSIEPLKNWKTKSLEVAMGMFKNCEEIDSISALSNWEINNVYNISYMFCNCIKLKSINDIKNWNLEKVTEYTGMFENCVSVESVEEIKDCNKKLFEIFNSTLNNKKISFLDTLDSAIKEAAKHNNDKCEENSIKKISYYTENLNWEWEITIFGEEFVSRNKDKIILNIYNKIIPLCSKYKMQNYGKNTIEIIEKEPLTDLSNMFQNCKTLTVIDDLENWKIDKVTNTKSMFSDCPYIISLKALQNWDTHSIIDTSYMFKNCTSINDLSPLKNWKMDSVNDTSDMFENCISIDSLSGLSNWNMDSVRNTIRMFKNCISLKSVEGLKNWKMSNVENTNSMFSNCNNIKSLDDLKNWAMNKVQIMSGMFEDCSSISSIKALKNWAMDSIQNTRNMFKNCNSISEEDKDLVNYLLSKSRK